MRTRPAALHGLAVALLLLPTPAAAFVPVSPVAAPSIGLMGFGVLETSFRGEEGYNSADRLGGPYTADQMMGILSALQVARQGGLHAQNATQRIRELWTMLEGGFLSTPKVYANVVPAPSNVGCLDVEVNAWALWAAVQTRAQGVDVGLDLAQRSTDLRLALGSLLQSSRHSGQTACNSAEGRLSTTHTGLPLWVLLMTRNASAEASQDNTVRSVLDRTIANNFMGGFVDEHGLVLSTFNSQMLLALVEAAQVFPQSNYAAVRDQLTDYLRANLTVRQGSSASLRQLQRQPGGAETVVGGSGPQDQLWAAAAFHNANLARPSEEVRALVAPLVGTFHERFWSGERGAYVAEDGLRTVEPNALATILFAPLELRAVSTDASSATVIVPAVLEYSYRATDAALVSGAAVARFTLASPTSGATDVVLPAQMLAAFNFSQPFADLYDPPRLLRLPPGAPQVEVPVSTVPGSVDLLRFEAGISRGGTLFRLEAYPPIQPIASQLAPNIVLLLRNVAHQPLVLRSLQLEIDVTNVTVESVEHNGRLVTGFTQVDGVTTEAVPHAHTRVTVPNLAIGADSDAEIKVQFADVVPPSIEPIEAFGRQRAPFPVPSGALPLLAGDPLSVRTRVSDNVLVRTVAVLVTQGEETRPVPATLGEDGEVFADLGVIGRTGKARVQISAVDVSGNFQSRGLDLEVQNPIISGNIVLFVFSGVLFFSAFIIWVKVRRKHRA